MWFVLSSSSWPLESICFTCLWFALVSTLSILTFITCSKKKIEPPPAAAPAPETAKQATDTGAAKEASTKFTASQQGKIDAELKAALDAEEKEAIHAKTKREAKKSKTKSKPNEDKTDGPSKGGADASIMAKGNDGQPPPVAPGNTKVDGLKAAETPKKNEHAPQEDARKEVSSIKYKKCDEKKDTSSKKYKKGDEKKVENTKKETNHKDDKPGAPLGPGKSPKPVVVDDGRSRYVGDMPVNQSAYIKPQPK